MKQGFVLLELLISILIAAFVSTGLLSTIFQISKLQQTVNTMSSVYGRVAILQNQMERDVMGAFVPAQVDVIQTSTLKADQPKPIEKIFYGTSKGERLDVLTFITSNPLEIFLGVKDAKIKPRVARVVYRLVPDEKRKNSYVLMRQEGTSNLSFDAYKIDAQGELRAFPLIDAIQSISVRYVTIEQTKGDGATKPKRTYKKVTQWESEQKKAPPATPSKPDISGTLLKKEPVRLPNQLEITVVLWDNSFKDVRTFQLTIPIAYKATEFEQPPKKESDEKKQTEKTENETGQVSTTEISITEINTVGAP
jgi:type II secretory pathway pseudopilin PulG